MARGSFGKLRMTGGQDDGWGVILSGSEESQRQDLVPRGSFGRKTHSG